MRKVTLLFFVAGGLLIAVVVKLLLVQTLVLRVAAPEGQYLWVFEGQTLEIPADVTISAGAQDMFVIYVNGDPKPAVLSPRPPGISLTPNVKYYAISQIQLHEGDKITTRGEPEFLIQAKTYAEVTLVRPLTRKAISILIVIEIAWCTVWAIGWYIFRL